MEIKTVTATIRGIAPYSQRKYVSAEKFPKKKGETALKWDHRVWKEKTHSDPAGNIVIPAMALKNIMHEVTKRNNRQIPGKGKKMWNGLFKTGILVTKAPIIYNPTTGKPWTLENIEYEDMLVGETEKGGKNEFRFPIMHQWTAEVEYRILDPVIEADVFEEYLSEAGVFTGLGRYRIGRGSLYGGFTVENFKWSVG